MKIIKKITAIPTNLARWGIIFGIAFLCTFFLTSCSVLSSPFHSSMGSCELNPENTYQGLNLLRETWLCELNSDPNAWIRCADPWFLTGQPNPLERVILRSSPSVVSVRAAYDHFTNINVRGAFQVQIVGGQEHNTVALIGPKASVRRVTMEIHKCSLFICETQPIRRKSDPPLASTEPVIVRIGVKKIRSITNCGCGHVFGRNIISNALIVNSTGRGNIMLVGKMNLLRVNQSNSGSVVVFGANTPRLTIKAMGNGNVNITGRVGIQCIDNTGCASVRIVGADTDSLIINANGRSRTSVIGYANVKVVNASEFARVYLYWVNACNTSVCARDFARVGLAGITHDLNVDLKKHSRFWGGSLYANTVYVQTSGSSHANVFAENTLFASAGGDSSIYYNGRPGTISQFSYGKSNILPVQSNGSCAPCLCKSQILRRICALSRRE